MRPLPRESCVPNSGDKARNKFQSELSIMTAPPISLITCLRFTGHKKALKTSANALQPLQGPGRGGVIKNLQNTFPRRLTFSFFSFITFLLVLQQFPAKADNEAVCLNPNIKTIRFHQDNAPFSYPVWELGSDKKLVLDFDDLSDDLHHYKFSIIHCESDWTTSTGITPFEYIAGFNEEPIRNFTYSYNTTIKYIHFSAFFPTDNLKPKLSGNYILIVFDEDPNQPQFIVRFMVVEPSSVSIEGAIVQPGRNENMYTHQQLDFLVRLNGFHVSDVGREIKTVIRQNGRWDNQMTLTQPRFIRGEELDYRYDDNLIFKGGNQFRYFDFASLVYQSERIATKSYDSINQVYLVPDEPRTYKNYINDEDINGHYIIKNSDHADNSDIEADYALVHFILPFPAKLTQGSFHVMGDLTLWEINKSNELVYNREGRRYELSMLLKQGYYNFIYVISLPGKQECDATLIEGSHWETENEYLVLVYFRETGALFDRLISVNTLNRGIK